MIKKILIAITIAAFLVRIINNNYPPLLWDEAAIGYNAYSLIHTSRDEYGQVLPIVFKSFGDYKPGLYVYLTIPFVAIFGLTEISVRLPSIILGSLLPLLLFLLITSLNPKSQKLGIIAAILLAFNPWNVHFSRGSWETNVLLFQLVLASYLFIKKKYIVSALIFAASLYTYQASKLLVPFMVITLLLHQKQFPKKFILILGIFFLPVVYGMFFGPNANRLKVMNLSAYTRPASEINTIIAESNNLDFSLFYSQPIFFARNFAQRYFNFFSTRFLIFEGDWQTLRHSAPYVGVILYPTFVFLILGLIIAIKNYKQHTFFLIWLLFAPIPSSLSLDIIQAVRGLNLSIPIIYFAALGLSTILNKKNIVYILVIYIASFAYYWDMYTHHMTQVKPEQSLVGYKQAVEYMQNNGQDKSKIFTNFYGQAYIYYLFYTKKLTTVNLTSNGVDTGVVESIDGVLFKTPDIRQIQNSKQKTIAILAYDEIIRQGFNIQDFVKISPIFYAYQN
ncbi:MAG: glycosyltransferase family 39 protein [Candidatus Shapirobacteria bacterium]